MELVELGALLGNFGEFFGAVAVLATLVYLAIQTRQARVAAQESAKFGALHATHEIVDLYAQWRRTVLSTPENAEIIAKADRGDSLSDADKIVVSLVFHDLFYGAAYSHASAVTQGSIHVESADVEYLATVLRQMPSALNEWGRCKRTVAKMNDDFVQRVDDTLAATSDPA